MTEGWFTVVVAGIISVGPTIAGIAAYKAARSNGKKADEQAVKIQEVHAQTDGHLTKLTEELAAARTRVESLEKMITTMLPHDPGNPTHRSEDPPQE